MLQDLQTVALPGGRLRYLDAGPRDAGRVLLLLHAFPVGVRMWAPQIEAFAGWRVVVPALPGFDGSDLPEEASMDAFARQVAALLDHLGVRAAVAVGVSMGGYVTFALWRLAAVRLRGLVLADTRSGADSDEARAGRLRLLERLEREGPPGVARDVLPNLFGATTQAERPDVVEVQRGYIAQQSPEGIGTAVRALMGRANSTDRLAGISVPTLVVVGAEDALTPPAEADRLRAGIRGASLVEIPRAGHLSNVEQPQAFNEAVGRFLGGRQ